MLHFMLLGWLYIFSFQVAMAENDQKTIEMAPTCMTSVNRIVKLPVVETSIQTASNVYEKVKVNWIDFWNEFSEFLKRFIPNLYSKKLMKIYFENFSYSRKTLSTSSQNVFHNLRYYKNKVLNVQSRKYSW